MGTEVCDKKLPRSTDNANKWNIVCLLCNVENERILLSKTTECVLPNFCEWVDTIIEA